MPIVLSILDVGHGNSAVLSDTKGTVVIDAGPGSSLLEFLIQEGIKKIDVFLVSHADEDHIKGIIAVLSSNIVKVQYIKLNSDASKGSKLWDDLTYVLDQANKNGKVAFDIGLTTNDSNKLNCGEISIEVLFPTPGLAAKGAGNIDHKGRSLTSNSMSAIVRLSRNEKPLVLLPGDIDGASLNNLVEEGIDLRSEIVVFPHHGGKPGFMDAKLFATQFCELVNPRTVIFSIGRGKHGNPKPEIMEAVLSKVTMARIACTQLSEHCAGTFLKTSHTHLTSKFSGGREKNKCCAGTITIDLEDPKLPILPNTLDHQRFIKHNAPTALCMKAHAGKVRNTTVGHAPTQ